MVSNTKEDFPHPEQPVTQINLFIGISRFKCFKLFSYASLIIIFSMVYTTPIIRAKNIYLLFIKDENVLFFFR